MADVVTRGSGNGRPPDKKVGHVRFTEMAWQLDFARAKPWAGWVNNFMHNQHTRVKGAIAFADANGAIDSYLDFADALLSGVTIGALDGVQS